jgi:steroid delta-isomerase-like uncharacterized protein
MSQQNKDLVRRSIEDVWNQGKYDTVEGYVSNDFVVHGSTATGEVYGADGVRAYFGSLRTAFPDLHFAIEDQIAEGDRVVTRWVAQGTHQGEFQGVAPTGARGRIIGHDIDRIADGKIVECWSIFDELGLMIQLGLVPSAEEVARS